MHYEIDMPLPSAVNLARAAKSELNNASLFAQRLSAPLDLELNEALQHFAGTVIDGNATMTTLEDIISDADETGPDVWSSVARQLLADLDAVADARKDFDAAVAAVTPDADLLFAVTYAGAIFREAENTMAAIASADGAADFYAGRFVPARDRFLDAVLKLAESTVSTADNIVEKLLPNT